MNKEGSASLFIPVGLQDDYDGPEARIHGPKEE